jgi:phosphohistidine swiveling domain-containing protein
MSHTVQSFNELVPERMAAAGGKGGTLARLYQAGYPVPDGFVVLPEAFAGDTLTVDGWAQVQTHLARMRQAENGLAAFAVRSSALSEDSAFASFAGEFETVLDVHSDPMIREAIHTVRRSRHSERVRAYSEAKGIDPLHDMAVVVQRLVRAEISGVLFTADPVTGSLNEMAGNFVYGFGEELVSGEAEPYTFTLGRPKGEYQGPPVLGRFARALYKLGRRLEKELGHPQDIEWAIADGRLFLLQSRPITTLIGDNLATGECNATLTGDYLWTNILLVELFPMAVTPSTKSVWQLIFDKMSVDTEHPAIEWIAARPYLNYSVMYTFLTKMLRDEQRVLDMMDTTIGLPPEGVEIPSAPISLKTILLRTIPRELKTEIHKRKLKANRSELLEALPKRCEWLRRQIQNAEDGSVLISLWCEEVRPLFLDLHTLQDAYNEAFAMQNRSFKKKAAKVLGEEEANRLASTAGSGSEQLASVGPLLGLFQVKQGQKTPEEYRAQYGHRAPYEDYLSIPRPYEDPDWIDAQLEEFDQAPVDVVGMLHKREAEFEAIWARLQPRLGSKQVRAFGRRINEMAETCIAREATRSELSRIVGVIRELFLRAGELSGLGDDVFFLTLDEVAQVLAGDESPTIAIPVRRDTYEQYRSLPPLPNWIRGRFDPFQWAEDPNRRVDLFDSSAPVPLSEFGTLVRGNPGSAGQVEGKVRRLDSPDERAQLKHGEILVTATTNIGWTPLFPRAAGIVTDIGGSLSHAAIVAREIGIPAVVGCGNATMRLHTGDWVRVDGARGTVEILKSVERKACTRGARDVVPL